MSWRVLRSSEDRSVNFVRDAGDGGLFEARFVARSDDYAIAYLSSHSGCRLACRFCHLTQTGQTGFMPASLWDLGGQLMRVLQHMDEEGLRPPAAARELHGARGAAGEPAPLCEFRAFRGARHPGGGAAGHDQNERTQAPSKRLYWWGSPQGCPLSPGVTAPGHTP